MQVFRNKKNRKLYKIYHVNPPGILGSWHRAHLLYDTSGSDAVTHTRNGEGKFRHYSDEKIKELFEEAWIQNHDA